MKDEKRTTRVEILLTREEADEIASAAKSDGLKVGAFIRMSALRLARQ